MGFHTSGIAPKLNWAVYQSSAKPDFDDDVFFLDNWKE